MYIYIHLYPQPGSERGSQSKVTVQVYSTVTGQSTKSEDQTNKSSQQASQPAPKNQWPAAGGEALEIHSHIYIYIYMHINMYIYKERERETECFLCFPDAWCLDTLHRGLRKLRHNQQLPERAEREG